MKALLTYTYRHGYGYLLAFLSIFLCFLFFFVLKGWIRFEPDSKGKEKLVVERLFTKTPTTAITTK